MVMSSRRRRSSPAISSAVGLIRFYEETEPLIKLNPYVIILITILTSLSVLALNIVFK